MEEGEENRDPNPDNNGDCLIPSETTLSVKVEKHETTELFEVKTTIKNEINEQTEIRTQINQLEEDENHG